MTKQELIMSLKRFLFGVKKQQGFLEDLSVLVSDGVPPNKAIDMLASISRGIVKDVALSLSKSISEGQPLADGMQFYFGNNVAALIRAGESGGALGETIQAAAEELGKKSGLFGTIIGTILYPLVVNVMAWGVIVYINASVFIDFLKIKPLSSWPPVGQSFVAYGNFLYYWWWSIFVLLAIIYFIVIQILRSITGPVRTILDKFPIFKLYRQIIAASFMETLGMLVANGVVFKEALGIIGFNAPEYLNWHIKKMENLLSQGFENIADVLDTGLIDEDSIARLRIVAEAKGFDHAIKRLGKASAEMALYKIKFAAKLIAGLMLAAGGLQIGFIIKAIYTVGMSLGT